MRTLAYRNRFIVIYIFNRTKRHRCGGQSIEIEGIALPGLLDVINLRIEAQLDREVQEYFFQDWERVRWVLNDHPKQPRHQFIAQANVQFDALLDDAARSLDKGRARWVVNGAAFSMLDS